MPAEKDPIWDYVQPVGDGAATSGNRKAQCTFCGCEKTTNPATWWSLRETGVHLKLCRVRSVTDCCLYITLKRLVYVRSNLRLQQRRKDTTYATWLAEAVDDEVHSEAEDATTASGADAADEAPNDIVDVQDE